MRWIIPALAAALGLAGPARAVDYYVTPEAPSTLTGAGLTLPWAVVRHDILAGTYTPSLLLPFNTHIDGLHRMDGGAWLLSVDSPVELGGTTFLPQDVIRFDEAAATYTLFFCGPSSHHLPAAGPPAGTNVDALFLAGGDGGSLVVSFDAPTTIGGVTYDPADLVAYLPPVPECAPCPCWSFAGLYFDASAATPPLGASNDVTGADRRGATTIITFDAPAPSGASAPFLPGELVAVGEGGVLSSFYRDPAWSDGSVISGLALLGGPGDVGPTLMATRDDPGGTTITLAWAPSCSAGAEDYGIYEGTLGDWYSHTEIDCSDGGTPLVETVATASGSTYYLVVPLNPSDEGSYGTDSAVVERPAGAPATCVPTQALEACP